MHPALQRSNILKLPVSLRKHALAAADGSYPDLLTVADSLDDPKLQRQHLMRLPAVYIAALDLAHFPTPTQMEAYTVEDYQNQLSRTMTAFVGIRQLNKLKVLPKEAAGELWEPLRRWMNLVGDLTEFLREDMDAEQAWDVHAQVMEMINTLYCASASEVNAFFKLDGAYIIIGRVWKELLRQPTPKQLTRELVNVSMIMGQENRHLEPNRLRDLMDGAGGSWDDLARLIVTHLHEISLYASDRFAVRCLQGLHGLLVNSSQEVPAFRSALLRSGSVAALARTCRSVRKARLLTSDEFRLVCIFYAAIQTTFLDAPSHVHFIEAVDAGYLLDFFDLTSQRFAFRNLLDKCFIPLLQRQLPAFLAYITVLKSPSLAASLKDIRLLMEQGHTIHHEEVLPLWQAFSSVEERRIAILAAPSPPSHATRFCESLSCWKVSKIADLRVCGGCRQAYYCSQDCQRHDWRTGHRDSCCFSPESEYGSDLLPQKDKKFLGRLLEADYPSVLPLIANKLVAWYGKQRPGIVVETPFVAFDYRTASTQPAVSLILPDDSSPYAFSRALAEKARRSGGRMQVHLCALNEEGKHTRWRAVPLYAASDALDRGLRELAAQWRDKAVNAVMHGEKAPKFELAQEIRELLEGLDVLEVGIH
ncbi:MYND-type domain-containing protein [Mycena indigotica]|uniref:MYND-type domain-containing protein n=1 Tax=Mycena indigotica TaxID=2126181 RepID=A0A8H6S237_9AGAR|nr:MYND-type domain-containing protein [Mycena indigotica]KAF7291321.1 MYND-type domain-containing protein [Mycena indigotica]